MKKIISYIVILVLAGLTLTSCSEDELDNQSIITVRQTNETQFDKWLKANLVNPYNIEIVYRYEDIESDMNYYAVPADYEQAVKLAHIVKYTAVEAYDEVAGVNFTRAYFPKRFQMSGEWEYRNNGTIILGTAEGGKKIFLYGVNWLNEYLSTGSMEDLNTFYLKTIHHEFTHILNQTKDYSADYQQITGSTYLADDWSTEEGKTDYLKRGYISSYAQHSHQEDFAEMLSIYVTHTSTEWDAFMSEAGEEGAALLNTKLGIVRDYMKASWNVDLDKLRDAVISREIDVLNGKVDLMDLTVK